MFWKFKPPVVPQERRSMVTDQAKQFEDRIVLEYMVEFIEKMDEESRRGFNYSANRLEKLLGQIPDKESEVYKTIKYHVAMLRHCADRMEYINAHKIEKTWSETKYRNFIEQFCPREENENDDDE